MNHSSDNSITPPPCMPSFYLLLPLLHIFQPLRIPIVGIMVKGHTIDVETAYGPFKFNYFISTPTQQLAEAVDPSLPTLLLLHGMYLASVVFHRKFNLSGNAIHVR